MHHRDQVEEESVNLNVENEGRNRPPPPVGAISRKSRFSNNRSKSADIAVVGGSSAATESGIRPKPRRLSNQFSMEMARRFRCSEEVDVVDDAGRREDLDEIQVHVNNSRSFGLSSSFLRRKKDEYEGEFISFFRCILNGNGLWGTERVNN